MPPWLPANRATANSPTNAASPTPRSNRSGSGFPRALRKARPPIPLRPPVFTPGWQLGTPDLVLPVSKAFSVPADGPDLFWNFVLSPAIAPNPLRQGRRGAPRQRPQRPPCQSPARPRPLQPASGEDSGRGLSRHGPEHRDCDLRSRQPLPLLEARRRSRASSPTAWRGGSIRATISSSTSTSIPPASRSWWQPSVGLYFTDKPPTKFPMLVQIERDSALDIPPGTRDFLDLRRFPPAD